MSWTTYKLLSELLTFFLPFLLLFYLIFNTKIFFLSCRSPSGSEIVFDSLSHTIYVQQLPSFLRSEFLSIVADWYALQIGTKQYQIRLLGYLTASGSLVHVDRLFGELLSYLMTISSLFPLHQSIFGSMFCPISDSFCSRNNISRRILQVLSHKKI